MLPLVHRTCLSWWNVAHQCARDPANQPGQHCAQPQGYGHQWSAGLRLHGPSPHADPDLGHGAAARLKCAGWWGAADPAGTKGRCLPYCHGIAVDYTGMKGRWLPYCHGTAVDYTGMKGRWVPYCHGTAADYTGMKGRWVPYCHGTAVDYTGMKGRWVPPILPWYCCRLHWDEGKVGPILPWYCCRLHWDEGKVGPILPWYCCRLHWDEGKVGPILPWYCCRLHWDEGKVGPILTWYCCRLNISYEIAFRQVQGSIWRLAFWSPWDSMGPQKWSPLAAMWSPKLEAHNPCYFQDVLSQWSDNVIKHINICFYCIMFYHNSKCI